MENLPAISNKNQEIFQVDTSIVDRLTAKNRKQGLSEGTKQTYKDIVRQFNQFLDDNGLLVDEYSLQLFFDAIKDKYAPSTLNLKKYALLKVIQAQVGSDSILKSLMVEKVFEQVETYQTDKAVTKENCLSEGQIKQLIETSTQKTGLLVEFLFTTACRVSEMIGIKLSDCKLNGNHVKIRIVGKGNKERFVYVTEDLYNRIIEGYKGQMYLFASKTGKQLNRVNVTKQIKNVGRKIGLDIGSHTFRHTRATDLLVNKEYSLKAVSTYLGHSSTAITADMYIHDSISPDDLFSKDL